MQLRHCGHLSNSGMKQELVGRTGSARYVSGEELRTEGDGKEKMLKRETCRYVRRDNGTIAAQWGQFKKNLKCQESNGTVQLKVTSETNGWSPLSCD